MAQKTFTSTVLTSSDVNTYLSHEGGAFTSWTPAVVQSGSVTCTVNRAVYARAGRLIQYWYSLTVTGSGTGSNAITVTTPTTMASSALIIGTGHLYDSSATTFYGFHLYGSSTTVTQLYTTSTDTSSVALGSAVFTAGLATGDLILGFGCYESAT